MLNNTLLNNQEIREDIKEEIKKYLETNDNENTTTQNVWAAEIGDVVRLMEIFEIARCFMKDSGNPNQWINGYRTVRPEDGNIYQFQQKG